MAKQVYADSNANSVYNKDGSKKSVAVPSPEVSDPKPSMAAKVSLGRDQQIIEEERPRPTNQEPLELVADDLSDNEDLESADMRQREQLPLSDFTRKQFIRISSIKQLVPWQV